MIPKGKGLPKYADDATLHQIRGKAMVGHQSIEDVWTLLDHLQLLEHVLDEEIDPEDALGPSGWREHIEAVGAQWSEK
jgi:hypothetical protein